MIVSIEQDNDVPLGQEFRYQSKVVKEDGQ